MDVSVVEAANRLEPAIPKRCSLPSMAAPAAVSAEPPWCASARVIRAAEAAQNRPITATIAWPWRRSPTIRPKVRGSAKGINSSRKTSSRLLKPVGFSNGWAELAL